MIEFFKPRHLIKLLKDEQSLGPAYKRYKYMNKSIHRNLLFYTIGKIRDTPLQHDLGDIRIMLNPKDTGLSKELFIMGYREPVCADVFQNHLSSDDVILDIGANIGYYVLLESLINTDGCIHALEPVPVNYEFLKKNIRLNRLNDQVICNQVAIGDYTGKTRIYYKDELNTASMLQDTYDDYVEVDMFTLDDYIKCFNIKNPSVVRMDVEGFEYHIIQGMKKTLSLPSLRLIFIEMHPRLLFDNGLDIENIFQVLFDAGFFPFSVVREMSSYDELYIPYRKENGCSLLNDFMCFLHGKNLLYPESKRSFGLFLIRGNGGDGFGS